MHPRHRVRVAVVASVLAIGLAGCISPSANVRPSSSSVVPSPSATPSAVITPAPTPVDAFTYHDADLGLEFAFPDHWGRLSATEIRNQLDLAVANGLSAEIADEQRARLDDGRIRFAITGGTPGGVQVSVGVGIETGLATPEAVEALARELADPTKRGSEVDVVDVAFAAGSGVRAIAKSSPTTEEGIPSQMVVYVLALPDGRHLAIFSTGTQEDTSFAALMESVVAAIRPADEPSPARPLPTAPSNAATAALADVGVTFRYPGTWKEQSLDELRAGLTRMAETESEYSGLEWLAAKIDAGELLLFLAGASEAGGSSLLVLVESGDADLAAAATRRGTEPGLLDARYTSIEEPVDLQYGPAVRVDVAGTSIGLPAHVIQYVTMLPDGRTLTFYTNVGTDPTIEDTMAWIADSLEVR